MGEVLLVQAPELRLPVFLLADHDALRRVRQRIDERVRVRGDDELASFGGFPKQIGQARQDVGMQPEFRFLETDQLRWGGVAQDGEQAKVAESSVGQPHCGNREVSLL